MAFSGAVKLADINDFLGPSQACIKPLLDAKKKEKEKETAKGEGVSVRARKGKRSRVKLELEMDEDTTTSTAPVVAPIGHFDQIRSTNDGKAKITLNDCLACSGCVTSAETVLITAQSTGEFLKRLKEKDTITVVSISPMALASIAVASKLGLLETARRLNAFLGQIGVKRFLDQSVAQSLALAQSREEFVERFRAKTTPVLCSECPGWVCYAEKTQGEPVLKYLSATRSPQQVMGVLVKTMTSKELGVDRKRIFHCAVMPCYDKKLEASRDEFVDKASESKDVDCVLTSAELMGVIDDFTNKGGLSGVQGVDLDKLFFNVSSDQKSLFRPLAIGASGGYLDNVFRYAAKELFGKEIKGELKLKQGRNPDIQEISLEIDGDVKLKFALAYGFRNIQNAMRKLKRGKKPYHYIEIMACPKGCANGGGQIKSETKNARDLAQDLQDAYYALPVREPEDTPIVKKFHEWTQAKAFGRNVLEMTFRDVTEKGTDGLTAKW